MAQKDLLNRSLDAGREAASVATERIEGLLDDLSRAAQEQRDQVAQIAQEFVDRSQKSSEQILKTVDRELRAQIAHLGLATKADIRRLEKKIELLQKQQKAAKAGSKAAKSSAKASKSAKASTSAKASKSSTSSKAAVKKGAKATAKATKSSATKTTKAPPTSASDGAPSGPSAE